MSEFNRAYSVVIHAVGVDIPSALEALGRGLGWGHIDGIVMQEVDVPCKWYVRFHADGTSMKASGEHVRGGVIVTWWK